VGAACSGRLGVVAGIPGAAFALIGRLPRNLRAETGRIRRLGRARDAHRGATITARARRSLSGRRPFERNFAGPHPALDAAVASV
jgi:hypothetical protein